MRPLPSPAGAHLASLYFAATLALVGWKIFSLGPLIRMAVNLALSLTDNLASSRAVLDAAFGGEALLAPLFDILDHESPGPALHSLEELLVRAGWAQSLSAATACAGGARISRISSLHLAPSCT